jgi:small subunit ribosomal protein S2
MLFVIDTNKESIAVAEARKLGIPVAAVLDSNSDPDGITYPLPGNDDASRAIGIYCDIVARGIIDGLSEGQLDAGESDTVLEDLSEPTPEAAATPDVVSTPESTTEEEKPSAATK